MGVLAALILFAGVRGSWGTAQHVMLAKGRESGTVRVTRCAGDTCTGPFTPTSAGARPRARVEIEKSVAVRTGSTYAVVLKPGTGDAVRSGPAGILFAWVPLGGALLLASVVVAGGMRLVRAAWVLGLSGAVLLTAAFAALQ
ncbi:membrane protein [Streptomyces antibioticus]|nr:membrane protein [Streptomyces antibioticus]